MFDKSNRYIHFLLDFVAVGFIRLFQIFQYSDISCPPSCVKEWRMRQHISKLMNSYILHDEPVLPVPSISRGAQLKDRATVRKCWHRQSR